MRAGVLPLFEKVMMVLPLIEQLMAEVQQQLAEMSLLVG